MARRTSRLAPYRQLGQVINEGLLSSNRKQKDLAGMLGIAESTMSEYLHGYTRPAPARLAHLARLLRLDLIEVIQASGYEGVDIEPLYVQMGPLTLGTDEFIDHARNRVDDVAKMRFRISPQLSLVESSYLISDLERRIEFERGITRKELQRLLMQTLHVRIHSNLDFRLPGEAVHFTLPDYRYALDLAQETGDIAGQAASASWLVDMYYVGKDYRKAVQHGEALLDEIDTHNARDYFVALVSLLVSYGYVGQRDNFKAVERLVLQLMDRNVFSSPYDRVIFLERMARARALLGLGEIDTRLQDAERELGSLVATVMPLRKIALLRTRLLSLRSTEKRSDIDQVGELIKEGLGLAREFGYRRHFAQFVDFSFQYGLDKQLGNELKIYRLDSK
jgi:transcriptional regulator with XRE-family HTH domain